MPGEQSANTNFKQGSGGDGGFFLGARIWEECSTIHSSPALSFLSGD